MSLKSINQSIPQKDKDRYREIHLNVIVKNISLQKVT